MDKVLAIAHAYDHLNDSMRAKQGIIDQQLENIYRAADILVQAFRAGNKVLLCGNGGSAADCQHMATEFMAGMYTPGGLPAIALTTDTSFLTAYSNDSDFDGVFASQISALGVPGDILICISTSGNSQNVIIASGEAERIGMPIIALVGGDGGRLLKVMRNFKHPQSNVLITIPHDNTQIIQECHLAIEHIIVDLVEREMLGAE